MWPYKKVNNRLPIVTLLVCRDGYYTLEGTDILVRACDLNNVWLSFGILLVIKPAASGIARLWLRRKMRKTLLVSPRMPGPSATPPHTSPHRRPRIATPARGRGRTPTGRLV